MKKLIFDVHEEKIEISQASKFLKFINVSSVFTFSRKGSENIEDKANIFNNGENVQELRSLFKINGVNRTKAEVVLSIDGMITRLIDVPCMKQGDLKKYIEGNIGKYFTVSSEEYNFDYRVVELKKAEKKTFTILLVAVPKEKLKDILGLFQNCGMRIDNVSIYPECVAKVFKNKKDKSSAILDLGNLKSSLTILDQDKIFVYSIIEADITDEDSIEELVANFNYFLNFYSTRHYGNKVDNIYLIDKEFDDDNFIVEDTAKVIGASVIHNLKKLGFNVTGPRKVLSRFSVQMLGLLQKKKAIYNSDINFAPKGIGRKSIDPFKAIIIPISAVMGIIFLFLFALGIYENSLLNNYGDPNLVKREMNIASIQKEIDANTIEKKKYDDEIKIISNIKSDEYDYLKIMNTIKGGLPSYISMKSLSINKTDVIMVIGINKSTLDTARAVIAVNNMNIFNRYEINEVKLDDTVNEATFNLTLK